MVRAVLAAEPVLRGQLVVGEQGGHFGEHPGAIVRMQVIEPPGRLERLVRPVPGDARDVLAHPGGRERRAGDGVRIDHRRARREHLLEAALRFPERLFDAPAPRQLARDQRAGNDRQGDCDQGSPPSREPGQASLRLEGRRALREQPFLVVLHLAHQFTYLLHQLLSPAADHGPAGGGGAPGAARLDGPLEPLEPGRDERVQRIEPALLRGIVRRQGPQPPQAAAQGRPREPVGRQVARVARDDVAAHPGFGLHKIGEAGLELRAHLQGVGHPVRTAHGRVGAAQRGGADGHDDGDGDAKPDLDPALERQARPHHARFRRSVVPSSTSRTVRARASGVKGFCTNTNPGSSTPWRVMASSV